MSQTPSSQVPLPSAATKKKIPMTHARTTHARRPRRHQPACAAICTFAFPVFFDRDKENTINTKYQHNPSRPPQKIKRIECF